MHYNIVQIIIAGSILARLLRWGRVALQRRRPGEPPSHLLALAHTANPLPVPQRAVPVHLNRDHPNDSTSTRAYLPHWRCPQCTRYPSANSRDCTPLRADRSPAAPWRSKLQSRSLQCAGRSPPVPRAPQQAAKRTRTQNQKNMRHERRRASRPLRPLLWTLCSFVPIYISIGSYF